MLVHNLLTLNRLCLRKDNALSSYIYSYLSWFKDACIFVLKSICTALLLTEFHILSPIKVDPLPFVFPFHIFFQLNTVIVIEYSNSNSEELKRQSFQPFSDYSNHYVFNTTLSSRIWQTFPWVCYVSYTKIKDVLRMWTVC